MQVRTFKEEDYPKIRELILSILTKEYPFDKPFFLSGGIGLNDVAKVNEIKESGLPVYAVDINSRFETKPGVKNIKEVKSFKNKLVR